MRKLLCFIMISTALLSCNNASRNVEKPENTKDSVTVTPKMGKWEVGTFEDEFGEDMEIKFVSLISEGKFSNSSATNEPAIATIQVFNRGVTFKLWEYGEFLMKGEEYVTARIKDSSGKVTELNMNNHTDGSIYGADTSIDTLFEILRKEGIVMFLFTVDTGASIPTEFCFKFDITGFKNAEKIIFQ